LNDETIAALNAINRKFYRERAPEFSASRERAWSGWGELFDRLAGVLPETPAVLDVGCGNGRFARFLEGRLGEGAFTYRGVDASPLGLGEARKRLGGRVTLRFFEHDFVAEDSPLPASLSSLSFDLVVLFGVLHHVPDRRKRLELLDRLAEALAPGGLLAYTLWRFDRHERFRKKLVPWEEFRLRTGVEIDLAELEPGDHVMTWGSGQGAFRYVHAASDDEEEALASFLSSRSLGIVTRFDARSEPNRYYAFSISSPGERPPSHPSGPFKR
jgi:SAM-dependent methyltransferase